MGGENQVQCEIIMDPAFGHRSRNYTERATPLAAAAAAAFPAPRRARTDSAPVTPKRHSFTCPSTVGNSNSSYLVDKKGLPDTIPILPFLTAGRSRHDWTSSSSSSSSILRMPRRRESLDLADLARSRSMAMLWDPSATTGTTLTVQQALAYLAFEDDDDDHSNQVKNVDDDDDDGALGNNDDESSLADSANSFATSAPLGYEASSILYF